MPAWPSSRTRSAVRSALAETKDRLIAMQMEHRAADARAKPLEAEVAQAKRAAEQATEQEMKQRQLNAELQDELVALKRGARGGKAPHLRSSRRSRHPPKPDAMATTTGADDLTVIKGIGKVIEEAARAGDHQLQPDRGHDPRRGAQGQRGDRVPGRVERENWIEQARQLARS